MSTHELRDDDVNVLTSSPQIELPVESYAAAPIVEAIMSIEVEPRLGLELDSLEHVYGDQDTFSGPTVTAEAVGEVRYTLSDPPTATRDAHIKGYTFESSATPYSEEGEHVAFCGATEFVYSTTEKYLTWERFLAHATNALSSYVAAVAPRRIVAVGIRYINKIELPDRVTDIRDYVRTTVEIPSFLTQSPVGFFGKIVLPIAEEGTVAITTASLPPDGDEPGGVQVVLDIDARRPVVIDVSAERMGDQLVDELASLRAVKNYAFEASITDATRSLIR